MDDLPASASGLRRLEQALECPICKSRFVAPVSLPCGHSFCSRCVRDALQERRECPVCREEAREGSVRRCRGLEEVGEAWGKLRDDILRLYREADAPNRKRKASHPPQAAPPKRPKTSADTQASKSGSKSIPGGGAIVLDLDEGSSEVESVSVNGDEVRALPVPSSQAGESRLVTCPACAQQLPLSSLNLHLDRGCPPARTKTTTTQKASWAALFSHPTTGAGSSTRASSDADAELLSKRISKPNYALVTPKELRMMLETYGCPTQGEKQALVERVQIWISLFNANLDASHPKPLKALRAELETQERGKNRDKEDAARAKQAFMNATEDDHAFKKLEEELRSRKKNKANKKAG